MVVITESPIMVNEIFSKQKVDSYGINLIKAKDVWNSSEKGDGVVIAVIDTGCHVGHPYLKNSIIGGYNFTNDDNGDPQIFEDYRGHGTHVAGIIAAGENEIGNVGVAPRSKILVLKTIDAYGKGSYNKVIKALIYAMDWVGPNGEKVSIINMSLGGIVHREDLYTVIKEARNKGILIVVAAGNEGDGNTDTIEISYPGFYQEVIQVGAVNQLGEISLYSNTNINLDFVAPGDNIVSTFLDGKYAELTGTSMATPFVSGALALVLNMISSQTNNPIVASHLAYFYLVKHAKKLGHSYLEEGNGLIQLI
ncbi:S8 family peptidase [Bacillus arachidis]|uniref:S8 family peptidase n=1 Tax=Bacillus arachidis TaxID=2819290 RepID=UPI00255C5827|nr:S8 family peptidase [Bacillus arachidis]WIY58994.1 S8 family peptidase [Bacillus arachidis]